MTETRTVTTLRRKRNEISATIRLYEKKLDYIARRRGPISEHFIGRQGRVNSAAMTMRIGSKRRY